MKNRVNQIYEQYWNYTAAFTDFNGKKFLETLKICVDFLTSHAGQPYDKLLYNEIQVALQNKVPVTGKGWDATQRKRINQLVKLGFIFPFLTGYPVESIDYLNAKTNRSRKNILSKIVYKYANFLNATTNDIKTQQLSFFIKTLEEVGSLEYKQLATLMTIDISKFGKEYATSKDLDKQYEEVDVEDFISRKYNQIEHLQNVIGRLDDLCIHEGVIYFQTDADRLFGDEETKKEVRDPYLQRVYKSELEEESCIHYECETPKCMLEGLCHPVLIASHIKPYISCKNDKDAQFDVNNGLLLSKNLDSLFDLGYITFDDEGVIIPSKVLDENMVAYLSQFRLHKDFINAKRMKYMQYHRDNVFEKKYSSRNVRKYIL